MLYQVRISDCARSNLHTNLKSGPLYQSELEYTPEHLRAGIPPPSGAAPAAAVSCTEREGFTALSAGANDPDIMFARTP